jgi:hypothetical protein
MSTPGRVALLDEARALGYQVELAFVATRDPHINIARVAARVAQNGHDVDPQKIIERYQRTLALLPSALDLSDYAYVFDNSDHNNGAEPVPPKLLGFKKEGLIERAELAEVSWFDEKVLPVCNNRSLERALVEGVLLPRIGNFQSYSGTVELSSPNFVWLRQDDATLTIHDRALIAPQAFMKGDRVAISYQYGADGKAVQVREQSRVITPATDLAGTGSVRERFKNLMSNTRAALDLETQANKQNINTQVSKPAPATELLRPQDEVRTTQSKHEERDEPGMDH